MNWTSTKEQLPKQCGWYLGAIKPDNYKELNIDEVNQWRNKYGCTKVWFNLESVGKWYEAEFHSGGNRCVEDLITHWSEMPKVPMIED